MEPLVDRPRATRYPMSAPVLYRRVGAGQWQEGRTVNVSRTGVLFEALATLEADTRIEFVLMLPSLGLPAQSRVQCQGRIVRMWAQPPDIGCAMAATIDVYDFLGVTTTVSSESVSG